MNTFPDYKGVYDHLIVHASATPPSMDIGAAWIDREHRRRGFSMCGYHAVITRSGELQWSGSGHRTRPYDQPGAHVGNCGPGWNRRSFGICLIGGVKEDGRTPQGNFTEEQYETLYDAITDAVEAFGIPHDNVMGHRDLIKITHAPPKACPCFSVREFIDGHLDLDNYDEDRLSFEWDKKLFPPTKRKEKLDLRNTYIVKKGDTLWSISRTLGVPLRDLRSLNKIAGNMITPGQRLQLVRN